jgi:hypothetical protein
MARSGTPAYLSWILAVLLHADVIVILAVVFAEDAVEEALPDEPDFHLTQLAPDRPMVPVQLSLESQFGGWPLRCEHRLRTLDISEDRLGDGLRCQSCGWPWWVIRAASPN